MYGKSVVNRFLFLKEALRRWKNTHRVRGDKRTFTIKTPYGEEVFEHFRKVTNSGYVSADEAAAMLAEKAIKTGRPPKFRSWVGFRHDEHS